MLIKSEMIEKNGKEFVMEYFGYFDENGNEVINGTRTMLDQTEIPSEPIPEPPLSETEQAILDTAINVDYLVCMKELEI